MFLTFPPPNVPISLMHTVYRFVILLMESQACTYDPPPPFTFSCFKLINLLIFIFLNKYILSHRNQGQADKHTCSSYRLVKKMYY